MKKKVATSATISESVTASCPVHHSLAEMGNNSVKILPQYFAYGRVADKITSSLHKSNFVCYNCINGITSTADEYNFTSYNCISNNNLWEDHRGRLP